MELLLKLIREELVKRRGSLISVSKESGVGYDTLRRVRSNAEYDPGITKVDALAKYFKFKIKISK